MLATLTIAASEKFQYNSQIVWTKQNQSTSQIVKQILITFYKTCLDSFRQPKHIAEEHEFLQYAYVFLWWKPHNEHREMSFDITRQQY